MNPYEQGELETLVAELRRARQHQHAERERLEELQREVEETMRRAAELLRRGRGG